MSIVLGTFTPTSLKFVDLSHHAQSWLDALKALQPLAAKNARRCSLIWWRWQTKQCKWHAIVFFPQLFCFANSRICAYFKVNVNNIALFCGNCVCSKVKTKGKMKFPFISARARARTIACLLQTRHFQTQLLPEVFKVKWIVVLLNRFSKLKRTLFEKRPIFNLPRVGFLIAL